jgi:hypothetical protein
MQPDIVPYKCETGHLRLFSEAGFGASVRFDPYSTAFIVLFYFIFLVFSFFCPLFLPWHGEMPPRLGSCCQVLSRGQSRLGISNPGYFATNLAVEELQVLTQQTRVSPKRQPSRQRSMSAAVVKEHTRPATSCLVRKHSKIAKASPQQEG